MARREIRHDPSVLIGDASAEGLQR